MKRYLNKKNLIVLCIMVFSFILLNYSIHKLTLDTSVHSLLPSDENLKRSVALSSHSSVSDKVILYIHAESKELLDKAIDETDTIIKEEKFLKDYLPDEDDISDIRAYIQKNALILYPYGYMNDPFNENELKRRLDSKYEYLVNSPFEDLGDTFFSDPLNMSFDILKMQFSAKNYLSIYKKGVLSHDGKSFIRVFSAGFFPEDFNQSKKLTQLDKEIGKKAVGGGYQSFIYSAHMYFTESSSVMQKEVSFISTASIVFTILIFLFFFRNIELLFYSLMPILAGISLTFFSINLIYGRFGAIALAFGATTAGICIDHTIHYFSKVSYYKTLKELRSHMGLDMVMGYLTTVVSFAILPFSKIPSLTEIAVFGLLVITFSFAVSWIVLQRLVKPEEFNYKIRVLDYGEGSASMRNIFIVFVVVALIFSFKIKLEDNAFGLDMNHKELDKRGNLIKKEFSESTDNVFIGFKGDTESEALEQSIKATVSIYKDKPEYLFLNPAIFIPTENIIKDRAKYIGDNFDKDIFDKLVADSEFTCDAFDPFCNGLKELNECKYKLDCVPDYLSTELKKSVVKYKDGYYYMVHIGDRSRVKEMKKILDKDSIKYVTVDILSDSASGLLTFEKRALILVIVSVFIIFILLLIVYRDVIFALSSTLPTVTGLIACFGVSGLTNTPLNIMHITACILIAGIGVDYGIFVSTVWKKGANKLEKNCTIQSILSAALTTVAGFGVLSLSSSKALFSLGISMFVGIITSFLTAYLIIPVFFRGKNI